MVESALFFVVGFLCATMLALLAAPAVSQRARRLANARARLQAPLSKSQARAERDALRAVQAIEIVRMQKRVAAAEWERAVARTDLAREASKGAKLEAAARELDRDLQFKDAESAKLEVALANAQAELGAKETALWDLAGQRDAAQRRLSEARTTIADLQNHIDNDRVEIATLSTQVSALEVELSDARANRRRFGENGQDIGERLRFSETAREDQAAETARLLRTLAERNAALTKLETGRDELERRLERARATEGELRAQLQASATERASAQGALMTEREARHHLQMEIDALKARLEETVASSETLAKGDAALRLAIAKLGRDLARARAAQDEEPHLAGQIVSFARREPMS